MASSSSPSSSSSGSWKYDVFLSFRGEDTRKTFVDHLYHALEQHGILTYKDDVTLARGDTIGPSLMKAIESSQISVIIFSENYADSSWCLDELSYIIKCRDSETGQIVMPIFYHVDPSDVRKQKGKYGEAFAKHELSGIDKNKVETWKKALFGASNIAGWEPKHVANGHEAKCIQEIVDSILGKLSSLDSVVEDEELVGMETRLEGLKSELRIGSGGVRMVGIWGIGGGGKTTLATSLYMEISGLFDGCCFLDNIREESGQKNGLKNLQEKLLSAVFEKEIKVQSVDIGKHTIKRMLCRRNVLIVLDDVDHLEQLEALAGYHNWFGNGSRIIITTRDEQVLESHRVDKVCHVSLLSRDEAIQLFKRHAYVKCNPVEDYENLSLRVISYANGLPLALKILGAFLYGKDKDEWLSTLDRLKYHPEMDIVQKLKISYDGLKPVEKDLFLDIACFFRREKRDRAMKILEFCGFYPRIGVKVLRQKALITVTEHGMFDMHDLIEEMGHYIVKGEHPNNPEKYSRVWRYEDIEDMCSRNATMENDEIEALKFDVRRCSPILFALVSKMKKLRFIKVTTSFYKGFNEGPSFLSNELRYIDWYGYPASPLPERFQPTKLVVLKLERSLQKEIWKGCKYLPNLKELQLLDASELVTTPDFGGLPCLQKLILNRCGSLEEIHQSLGNHSSLVYVHVMECNKLRRFPSIVEMKNLKTLDISECPALIELPKIEANMDNLVDLFLYKVGIEVLPSSVGKYCTNLSSIRLSECSNIKSIESDFHALKGLKKFELSGCSQFQKLPNDLFNENLGHLHLLLNLESGSIIRLILSHFPRFLRKLNLSECGLKDGEIPPEIVDLSNLQDLDLMYNNFTCLDFSLLKLTRLKLLKLSYCQNLVKLPELPSSLAILMAVGCRSLEAIIRDEIHINCKWLSHVSLTYGPKMIGGERLLETMLQGNAIETQCMILYLQGLETAKGWTVPRLEFRGWRCRMQLPENWYNHFSGFLFCTVFDNRYFDPEITMKNVEKTVDNGDIITMKHKETVVDDSWNQSLDDYNPRTWVGYISFGFLRNTLWWDQTSTAIEIDIYSRTSILSGCGFKLVPKRSGITDSYSFDDVSNDYTCRPEILHDSKFAFKCTFIDKLYCSN